MINPSSRTIPSILAATAVFAVGVISSHAATISVGDVTSELGPNFFFDLTTTGASDFTVNEPASGLFRRDFGPLDFGGGGSLRFKTDTGVATAAGTKLSVAGTSVAVVPEPSAALLGALGFLGLLLRRRP